MQNREDLSGGVAFMRPRQAESKIVQLLWLNPSPSYHLHVKTMLMIIIICKIMDNETSWWPFYEWLNPSPSSHPCEYHIFITYNSLSAKCGILWIQLLDLYLQKFRPQNLELYAKVQKLQFLNLSVKLLKFKSCSLFLPSFWGNVPRRQGSAVSI